MFARLLNRKNGAHAEEQRTLSAQDFWPNLLPGEVVPGNAMSIGDAYACIRALADAAGSLPLHVYRYTDNGRVRLENRTAELLRSPAPGTTQAGLVGQMVTHLNTHGNAFIGKYKDDGGRVAQLALLDPGRVQVAQKAGRIVFTVHNTQGPATKHGFDDIIHVKALSTDGLVGLSPIRQAKKTLELSRALTENAKGYFENPRPAGVVKGLRGGVPGTSFPGDAGAAHEAFNRDLNPWEQARPHRVALMTGDIEYVPVEMPHDQAQFLEQRKLSATEVARVFRVPPWVIGAEDGGSMTYSNTEMQSLHFATYSLRPWLTQIEQTLSADRDLFSRNTYCEFKLDGLLRADSKTRSEVYTAALNAETGWMSRAEVRELENLQPEGET